MQHFSATWRTVCVPTELILVCASYALSSRINRMSHLRTGVTCSKTNSYTSVPKHLTCSLHVLKAFVLL